MDVTDLLPYIEEQNQMHPEYKTTIFHCIVTAVARVVSMRPYLNRFICGRKLYERNDISLSFIAKRKFADHSEESLMTLITKEDMNLDYVTRKIVGDVKELRESRGSNDFDGVIDTIGHLPNPILHVFIGLLQRLSAMAKLPDVLTQGDTNHTTVLLSKSGQYQVPQLLSSPQQLWYQQHYDHRGRSQEGAPGHARRHHQASGRSDAGLHRR